MLVVRDVLVLCKLAGGLTSNKELAVFAEGFESMNCMNDAMMNCMFNFYEFLLNNSAEGTEIS